MPQLATDFTSLSRTLGAESCRRIPPCTIRTSEAAVRIVGRAA